MYLKNILLIDDDIDDLDIALAAIDSISNAIVPITMSSATEALKQLQSQQLKPDLIFLDLNMPIMTGQQFLMEIKKLDTLKDIPVVVLSTTSNPTTIRLVKELGIIEFITKPTRFDELVKVLRACIEKE